MPDDRVEITPEAARNCTHQNWSRCLSDVGCSLTSLANDMYQCWNHRLAPQHSTVLALRYMRLELDSALHFANREIADMKVEIERLKKNQR